MIIWKFNFEWKHKCFGKYFFFLFFLKLLQISIERKIGLLVFSCYLLGYKAAVWISEAMKKLTTGTSTPLVTSGKETSLSLSCSMTMWLRSSIFRPSQGRTTLLPRVQFNQASKGSLEIHVLHQPYWTVERHRTCIKWEKRKKNPRVTRIANARVMPRKTYLRKKICTNKDISKRGNSEK